MNRGFTLVEIIVALGLFGVAVAISIGSLISLFNANSRAQSIASVMNNLNFSIEQMTRTIRFATTYHCGTSGTLTSPNPCSNGDTGLAVSTSSVAVVFRWNQTTNKIEMSANGGSTYLPITSSEVTITYARFFVLNTTVGDERQPYVLMILRGYAGRKPSTQSTFDIQALVSQRELNI